MKQGHPGVGEGVNVRWKQGIQARPGRPRRGRERRMRSDLRIEGLMGLGGSELERQDVVVGKWMLERG